MSLPSRALIRALAQDIARSPGRHIVTNARAERYTTIRTFFKQQLMTSNNIWTVYTHPRRSLSLPTTRQFPRSFHASPLQTKQRASRTGSAPEPEIPAAKEAATPPPLQPAPNRFDHYPQFFRRLALSVPNIHRPTRDDMLNAASGFWERARIRFKWFTIKSFRRFNADDISAFITWFLMSQTLWILVGT